MGRTLWERMTGSNKPVPVEDRYQNPAKIKIGGIMEVQTIDYRGQFFSVREIRNWIRVLLGNQRIITDYSLLARPHDGEDVEILLRMIPRENPDPAAGLTHHVCVLHRFFECGWDDEDERKGILEAVSDPQGELCWHRGEPDEATFWRINIKSAYDCEVIVIKDLDGNGKVEENEVRVEHCQLWDYHRETQDEAGQPMIEYLFVHFDKEAKTFEAWRGEEVDLSQIRA